MAAQDQAMHNAHSNKYGALLLKNQLKEMMKNPVDGFSVGLVDDADVYRWRVLVQGPEGTLFEGGYFPCLLTFPKDYPDKPPEMRFETKGFWHPNVYPDGRVCISILHEAKEDQFNQQEHISEKWRPILGVESILISVVSMLSDPNLESPANIDASVMYKNEPQEYKKRVRAIVRRSIDEL